MKHKFRKVGLGVTSVVLATAFTPITAQAATTSIPNPVTISFTTGSRTINLPPHIYEGKVNFVVQGAPGGDGLNGEAGGSGENISGFFQVSSGTTTPLTIVVGAPGGQPTGGGGTGGAGGTVANNISASLNGGAGGAAPGGAAPGGGGGGASAIEGSSPNLLIIAGGGGGAGGAGLQTVPGNNYPSTSYNQGANGGAAGFNSGSAGGTSTHCPVYGTTCGSGGAGGESNTPHINGLGGAGGAGGQSADNSGINGSPGGQGAYFDGSSGGQGGAGTTQLAAGTETGGYGAGGGGGGGGGGYASGGGGGGGSVSNNVVPGTNGGGAPGGAGGGGSSYVQGASYTGLSPESGSAYVELSYVLDVAPSLSITPSATVVDGQTQNINISASGFPAPTLTSSGLPAGLEITNGAITGSPTASPGVYNATVTASNPAGQTTQSIVITVDQVPSVQIANPSPMVTQNSGVTIPLIVSGSPAPTLTSSGLPAGLELVNGAITGSPTVSSGVYDATITAQNSVGEGSLSIEITVKLAKQPLPVTSLTPTGSTSTTTNKSSGTTINNNGGGSTTNNYKTVVVAGTSKKQMPFDPFKATLIGHLHGTIYTTINPARLFLSAKPLSFAGKFGYCPFKNSTRDCGSIKISVLTAIETEHLMLDGKNALRKKTSYAGQITIFDRQQAFLFRTFRVVHVKLHALTISGEFIGKARKIFWVKTKDGLLVKKVHWYPEKLTFAVVNKNA